MTDWQAVSWRNGAVLAAFWQPPCSSGDGHSQLLLAAIYLWKIAYNYKYHPHTHPRRVVGRPIQWPSHYLTALRASGDATPRPPLPSAPSPVQPTLWWLVTVLAAWLDEEQERPSWDKVSARSRNHRGRPAVVSAGTWIDVFCAEARCECNDLVDTPSTTLYMCII